MKKLNFVLLFSVGLFFVGTQLAVAQVEEENSEIETTTTTETVEKPLKKGKKTTTTTTVETETKGDKKSETPVRVNGEGTKKDLKDDELKEDDK